MLHRQYQYKSTHCTCYTLLFWHVPWHLSFLLLHHQMQLFFPLVMLRSRIWWVCMSYKLCYCYYKNILLTYSEYQYKKRRKKLRSLRICESGFFIFNSQVKILISQESQVFGGYLARLNSEELFFLSFLVDSITVWIPLTLAKMPRCMMSSIGSFIWIHQYTNSWPFLS